MREQYNKIDESKVQKLDELILPSFKINASNFESVCYALEKDHLVSLTSQGLVTLAAKPQAYSLD